MTVASSASAASHVHQMSKGLERGLSYAAIRMTPSGSGASSENLNLNVTVIKIHKHSAHLSLIFHLYL